jgi:hypothetical protein
MGKLWYIPQPLIAGLPLQLHMFGIIPIKEPSPWSVATFAQHPTVETKMAMDQ